MKWPEEERTQRKGGSNKVGAKTCAMTDKKDSEMH